MRRGHNMENDKQLMEAHMIDIAILFVFFLALGWLLEVLGVPTEAFAVLRPSMQRTRDLPRARRF